MELLAGEGDFTTSLVRALNEIDKDWVEYEGLIIPGSHTMSRFSEQLSAVKEAREEGIPYLGICWGHQIAVIEYARNVLGIKDATSEELGVGTHVIKKRPTLRVGLKDGESYWSNYEVNIEWEKPKNFITVPYHPEYQSMKDKPHPDLLKFLSLCRRTAATHNH